MGLNTAEKGGPTAVVSSCILFLSCANTYIASYIVTLEQNQLKKTGFFFFFCISARSIAIGLTAFVTPAKSKAKVTGFSL